MKKIWISLIVFCLVFCLLMVVFCLHPSEQAYAAETLKVLQDHFEFRDEPRAADETLIGTLRIGTPVEWTGEASGDWLKIKAPNGQIGWVHSSGLSKPTTPAQPTPTPHSQSSRAVSAPDSSAQSHVQVTIQKLEQANKQHQKTIAEKDRRIAKLTKEIEALEAKLADVARMIDDQKEFSEVKQTEIDQLQHELVALQEEITKKDDALQAEKVERTTAYNQLNELQTQAQERSSRERFWLYALSLPLNILAFLIIGFWGIRRLRQKKPEEIEFEAPIREQEKTDAFMNAPQPEKKETPEMNMPSQEEKVENHDAETGMEELNIMIAASAASSGEYEENVTPGDRMSNEEVMIAGTDTLPQEESLVSAEEEHEIVATELEPEEILSEEIIETIEEEPQQKEHFFEPLGREHADETVEYKIPEEVEIEGERFEMLVERNTQIIELTEEEDHAERRVIDTENTVSEDLKILDDNSVVITVEPAEEMFESSDLDVTPIFEPETSQADQHESVEQKERRIIEEQMPSFLEPTPILIEPEYEPEERLLEQETVDAASDERSKEPRYDIELVDAGKNSRHIIHILSKVEGLTRAPQELVEHTPCIIAYGARETDAKNFQVVMQKFGSEVRLIPK